MSPLKALLGLVSLLFDLFAPVKTMQPWPDGEQPLIEDDGLVSLPTWRDEKGALQCAYGTVYEDAHGRNLADDRAVFEPMPGWFRGGFDEESSALSGSTASEAGVDSEAEGPTPGRAHTLGVGHPNVTAALLISAAIGLREYAASADCEAPTYWKAIADQLDSK